VRPLSSSAAAKATQSRSERIFTAALSRFVLILSLRGIRHRDALGPLDEDKGGAADEGHTRGTGQSFPQHPHLRAIAFDRQFGHAPLSLGLDQASADLQFAAHRADSAVSMSRLAPSYRRCRQRSPECGRAGR